MSNDVIISAENVGKKFSRSLKRTLIYGVQDVARDVFGIAPKSEELRRDEFWALNDVSFEVKRGECLGLIGANGAGKSTLLKLLNGVVLPDKGTIRVYGRVGALLELGAGFHPMLTGRENIHLSGAILSLSKKEIEDKFDAIVEFFGLKDFIDSPVKYYSSGMYVRLAFAVAVHAEPDILLIDEALAVGDVLFQAKCFAKLGEFKEKGTTIVFVTHSLDLVTSHCSRALLLDKGGLIREGVSKEIVDHYNRLASLKGELETPAVLTNRNASRRLRVSKEVEWSKLFRINPSETRYGSRKSEILEAGIFTPDGSAAQALERNKEYLIRVKLRHNEAMPAAIVSFVIKDPRGTVLCGTNTSFQNAAMEFMKGGDVAVLTFTQRIRLNPGEYLLSVGSQELAPDGYVVHDIRIDYLTFQVTGEERRHGYFDPDSIITWDSLS